MIWFHFKINLDKMFESKNYQEKMTDTCILILVKKKKKIGLDKLK